MSSPLDNRMRVIARQEAGALLGVPGGVPEVDASAPTVEQMQQQITDLHEHLHLATTRLSGLDARIEALEKASGQADQEERPTARRVTRKTSGATPTPE